MEKLHMDLAPFIRHSDTTKTLMADTVLALCAVLIWSVFVNGPRALVITSLTAFSSCAAEYFFTKVLKRRGTVRDLSALVTGMILAGCMPAGAPLWLCPAAAVIAVGVFKALFGGLGKNRFNPAAASILVLSAVMPITMRSVSVSNIAPFEIRPVFAGIITSTDAVNGGAALPERFRDLILGYDGTMLFFAPSLLIVLCGIYLFLRHTADVRTAVSFTAVSFASALVGSDLNVEYALSYLFTGGMLFAAVFMLTDPVTSPATNTGRWVYGALAAMICFVMRRLTGFSASVCAAVCAADLLVPVIERLTAPTPFGTGRRGIRAKVKRHRDYVSEFVRLFQKNKADIDRRRVAASDTGMKAQVLCGGRLSFCKTRSVYDGAPDCASSVVVGGGSRSCPDCCEGFGDCAKVCPRGAIEVIDGAAAVDVRLCDGCGECLAACPKQLITLIPETAAFWVGCVSGEDKNSTQKHCGAGCTGCGVCENVCPEGAIKVKDGRAAIDYERCTGCGLCAESCPRKCIWQTR